MQVTRMRVAVTAGEEEIVGKLDKNPTGSVGLDKLLVASGGEHTDSLRAGKGVICPVQALVYVLVFYPFHCSREP